MTIKPAKDLLLPEESGSKFPIECNYIWTTYQKLMLDITALNLCNFGYCSILLKPHSTCYFGRYYPDSKKIFLYLYRDKYRTQPYSYSHLLYTLVHEYVHHIQHSDSEFVRHRGVMHNAQFFRLFNEYWEQAKEMLKMRGEEVDSISEKVI